MFDTTLFHGDNVAVQKPRILENGSYKDFGYGFYCTTLEKQAKRWALTKPRKYVVDKYQFIAQKGLNIKVFKNMSGEWLQFIVNCRKGIAHGYDIVEGAMADDTIWDYIEDYTAGKISQEAFGVLAKFKYPTHQVVFCTKKALGTLRVWRELYIMKDQFFPDEEIIDEDLYFLCHMIERTARRSHQKTDIS